MKNNTCKRDYFHGDYGLYLPEQRMTGSGMRLRYAQNPRNVLGRERMRIPIGSRRSLRSSSVIMRAKVGDEEDEFDDESREKEF